LLKAALARPDGDNYPARLALTGVRVEVKGQNPERLKKGIKRWRKWLVEQDKDTSE
jgi:hypothetical protein